MPEQVIDDQQQVSQEQGQQQEVQQQVIDWESDENPYKRRYGDSQGQVTPLVNTLKEFAEYDHNTRTWKPKTQQRQQTQEVDRDKLLEGYDPEFVKAFKGYIAPMEKELSDFREQRKQQEYITHYNEGVKSARARALEEFGNDFELAKDGKFNPASPLYKLADQILSKEYARFNPDGTFHSFSTPDAEYLAITRAFAVIQKKIKADPNFLSGKAKLGVQQGKGGTGTGHKKNLSFEEYSKMSNEEKDAYDMAQVG